MNKEEIVALSMEGESIYEKNEIGLVSINNDLSRNEILEKSKEFIIGGIVSTSSIDLENERITHHALELIWEHIQQLDEGLRNVCVGHTSTQIGSILLKYKNRRSALLDEGLYLICKIRQDVPIALSTIEKIKSGELDSFSIKVGIPGPLSESIKTVCDFDTCWRDLKSAYFIEVSITDSPANPDCEGTVKILS